jgi:DNA-binding MarR family transcriptional regulator
MISTSDVQSTDYLALATFRQELRRFLAFSESLSYQAGLEPQQQQLMLAVKGLAGDESATIRTLAGRLQLRQNSVVELVDRLAAKGLVERQRSEGDRRRVVVTLTAAGEQTLRPLVRRTLVAMLDVGPVLVQALEEVMAHARVRA